MNEDELLDLLALMFDAYEEGPDCYEDPDECAGRIGKAVHLDDAAFDRIADILNLRRPRNAGAGTTATEGHNVERTRRPADSSPGVLYWVREDCSHGVMIRVPELDKEVLR